MGTTIQYLKVFFQDDTKDAVAGGAVAANAALVSDAVRCMPLPASRMPEHAVPLGHERFSACADESKGGDEPQEPDFTVFLTRPCLSIDQVSTEQNNKLNMSTCALLSFMQEDDRTAVVLY